MPVRRRTALKSLIFLGIGSASGIGFWAFQAHGKKHAPLPHHNGTFLRCAPGKWGTLEYERVTIEPPEQLLPVDHYHQPTRWFFKNYSRQQVIAFLSSAGLSLVQLNAIRPDQWSEENQGIVFTPDLDFAINLSGEARQKIYSTLTTFPEHLAYFDVFIFQPQDLDNISQGAEVPQEAVQLFRRLLYKSYNAVVFSDVQAVLHTLPDDHIKARFLQMIVRRPMLQVTLKINKQSNLDELAEYWGSPGRKEFLRAKFESLAGVDGGSTIDITELLPPFAQSHVGRFPSSSKPEELTQNCHWTALNFFKEPPTDAFLYPDEVEKELASNYARISSPPELGDLILFRNGARNIVHSAIFIADRIIFTKNGEGISQPWAFMTIDEVTSSYAAVMGPILASAYRHRLA